MKARELTTSIELLSKSKNHTVLNMIACQNGYVLIEQATMLLSVSKCIVIRDHVGLGTNGIHRLKQALEALVPFLKGMLIPPLIINTVSLAERTSIYPCRVYEMNCLINKKLNSQSMCTFFFCENQGSNPDLISRNSSRGTEQKLVFRNKNLVPGFHGT